MAFREELVYWDENEWREDPSVTPAIAAAITLGFVEGPDAVRARLEAERVQRIVNRISAE